MSAWILHSCAFDECLWRYSCFAAVFLLEMVDADSTGRSNCKAGPNASCGM